MSLLDAFTHSRGIMVFVNEWKSYNPIKNIPVGPIHGMETFPISASKHVQLPINKYRMGIIQKTLET